MLRVGGRTPRMSRRARAPELGCDALESEGNEVSGRFRAAGAAMKPSWRGARTDVAALLFRRDAAYGVGARAGRRFRS